MKILKDFSRWCFVTDGRAGRNHLPIILFFFTLSVTLNSYSQSCSRHSYVGLHST